MFSQVFEVEEIQNIMKKDEGVYYLVKWKGYAVPSWQPEDNLVNCTEALRDFHSVSSTDDE